jgi:hypothetical protein
MEDGTRRLILNLWIIYLPIPENTKHEIITGFERKYETVIPYLEKYTSKHDIDLFKDLSFPSVLLQQNMHLDPDFNHLTYGDNGNIRGKGASSLEKGDFIVFYSGLKPFKPYHDNLVYALIGYYEVEKTMWAKDVSENQRDDNAHLRKKVVHPTDIIVYANPNRSGRFRHCIPVGEYRNRFYRITDPLLEEWGGLGIKDGFIQRNINPPFFNNCDKFLKWLEDKSPEFIHQNFGTKED